MKSEFILLEDYMQFLYVVVCDVFVWIDYYLYFIQENIENKIEILYRIKYVIVVMQGIRLRKLMVGKIVINQK